MSNRWNKTGIGARVRRQLARSRPVVLVFVGSLATFFSASPNAPFQQRSSASGPNQHVWQDESEASQHDELVASLDAAEFLAREDATRQLIEIGPPMLPTLLKALPTFSAEGRARTFYVLHSLGADLDETRSQQARSSLETLIQDKRTRLSQPARLALDSLDQLRSLRIVDRLAAEGAKVTHRFMIVKGQYIRVPDLIEIDEQWQGETSSLQQLKWVSHVNRVSLIGQQIDDQVVEAVLGNPHLVYLNVREANITDRAFNKLALAEQVAALSGLSVGYCPISDESIASIGDQKSLQLVELYGTRISDEGADQLRELLPIAEIDHRKGGFLGVRCALGEQICRISTVEPNGAAAQAGVQAGDIITQFAGKDVDGIESLIEVSRNLGPGEKVVIEIVRRGQPIELTIELGKSTR